MPSSYPVTKHGTERVKRQFMKKRIRVCMFSFQVCTGNSSKTSALLPKKGASQDFCCCAAKQKRVNLRQSRFFLCLRGITSCPKFPPNESLLNQIRTKRSLLLSSTAPEDKYRQSRDWGGKRRTIASIKQEIKPANPPMRCPPNPSYPRPKSK